MSVLPSLSRRRMLGLTAAAASLPLISAAAAPAEPNGDGELRIGTGQTTLTWRRRGATLALQQMERRGLPPVLYADAALRHAGASAIGNPLHVIILTGAYAGSYPMSAFSLTHLDHTADRLLAYLQHPAVPMQIGLEVTVEGDAVTWRAQVVWNGAEDADADIYFPLLSRVKLDGASDRLIAAHISGATYDSIASLNFTASYLGGLSSPAFLLQGSEHGVAFLERNRADLAADPAGCHQRSCVVGTKFPLPPNGDAALATPAGEDGPFAGWRHRRLLLGSSRFGGEAAYQDAETHGELPLKKVGDSVDLGPLQTYLYRGPWKTGALWLREKRQHLPFRQSPAKWYRDSSFLSEQDPDALLRMNGSFYDLPLLLEERHALGSDMMSLPGFTEPEILGTAENMLNRGDYAYPAENLGGWEALRRGVDATHRRGGHVLLYVEGLIVWKRSRIGRGKAQEWALMDADGKFTKNYQGFFDMCPAVPEWQDWFARTLAEVVRTTGVDGFFMDSMLATDNHRCFNPKHAHAPQPDIWNWGLRRVLQRVREEVDKVDPATVLLCEGAGDLARQFTDGSLSHTHAWSRMHFSTPLLRFLHPQLRAFEATGQQPRAKESRTAPVLWPLLWTAVQGHRIFVEEENHQQIGPHSRRIREYFDLFPEICDAEMSSTDVVTSNCIAQSFDGLPPVLTVGNDSDTARQATVQFPAAAPVGLLFDRRDGTRVPVADGKASFPLEPWQFRAFELRV